MSQSKSTTLTAPDTAKPDAPKKVYPMPQVAEWLKLDQWARFKGLDNPKPVRSIPDMDGFTYEAEILQNEPGHKIRISQRVPTVNRMTLQSRLAAVDGEIKQLIRDLEMNEDILENNKKGIAQLEAAKKTKADPEWIKSQEDAMNGLEILMPQLEEKVEAIKENLESKYEDYEKLEAIDLDMANEWIVDLEAI